MIFGFVLLDYNVDFQTLVVFLFMVQAWIPSTHYFLAYNDVAWSISTEFFFYLLFPILIYSWNKTYIAKLFLSFCIVIGMMLLSNHIGPRFDIGAFELIYISPLTRIFEFIFGMTLAYYYKKNVNNKISVGIATIYEVVSILVVIIFIIYSQYISTFFNSQILSPALDAWIIHNSSMFVFGLLIYIIAKGNGKISNIFNNKFFVILGEISFSIYLFHQIILKYYRINQENYSLYPESIAFIIFLLIVLCISYLAWWFVELPMRRLIMGHKIHLIDETKNVSSFPLINKNVILIMFFLISLILLLFISVKYKIYINKNIYEISNKKIYTLSDDNLQYHRDIYMIGQYQNSIYLKSTGIDPIISLPPLDIQVDKRYMINIKLNVSQSTFLQIFYNDISPNNVITKNLIKGENDILILLDGKNLGNNIRLDPVSSSDTDIVIHSLEIKELL